MEREVGSIELLARYDGRYAVGDLFKGEIGLLNTLVNDLEIAGILAPEGIYRVILPCQVGQSVQRRFAKETDANVYARILTQRLHTPRQATKREYTQEALSDARDMIDTFEEARLGRDRQFKLFSEAA